ncbi:NUDIX hydrolase [Streptomyces hygroscopicus]|uniref:NUDIX hydrolase n=1 Tax=Streptomyces hygroscopicus TaxID=1912 RepID=UPI002240501B|nr:NUDIX hydrolase [Streptomyces hygroscopicus]
MSDAYDDLRTEQPELFRNDDDPAAITIIDRAQADPQLGPVGLLYEDPWIRLVRDPVRFPGGRIGAYQRIIPATASEGAAILPVLDGKVVMLDHYRHALRSWTLEIPRGFGTNGLDPQANALKELQEELSATVTSFTSLGAVHPDTGLQATRVRLYYAQLTAIGSLETEAGIRGTVLLTPAELDQHILDGRVTDGFTLAALAQARIRGLVQQSR